MRENAPVMENKQFPKICVFAGSADGLAEDYLSGAFQLGQKLARAGITLVYGAGKTGLMGAVADGVLKTGGKVVGVVPENLNQPQLIHAGLTRLEVLPDIQRRKARMSEMASAFIALPGGFGTFDELFETLTWAQIGLHHKPVGLMNLRGYFDPLLNMVQHACDEGFIYAEHMDLFVSGSTPQELLERLAAYHIPQGLDRWVNREEQEL
jgi:uncharacterized protein (TIGR00730 family)